MIHTLWAAVAMLIVVAILWRLFWLPVFRSCSEQRVLAGFLIGMPVIRPRLWAQYEALGRDQPKDLQGPRFPRSAAAVLEEGALGRQC